MSELDQFVSLSQILTAAPVLDVSRAQRYLDKLKTAYPVQLPALLAATTNVVANDISALVTDLQFKPVLQQIIGIWFTGEYVTQAPDNIPMPATQEDFYAGLLWEVVRAHPPTRSGADYGYWATPPQAN